MTLKAVVFDLDGTLVDTLPDLHAALTALLIESGLEVPPADTVRRMVGDGARMLVERALAWSKGAVSQAELDAAHARFLTIYNTAPCAGSRIFPNVEATLERLQQGGIRLGVCTNKPQQPTDTILAGLRLAPRFVAAVGGDAVARRKPHPDHPRRVLELLGATPDAALMVGDSRNDVAAARSCGMKCILVSFGYTTVPAIDLGADRVIDDFAELPAAIDSLTVH